MNPWGIATYTLAAAVAVVAVADMTHQHARPTPGPVVSQEPVWFDTAEPLMCMLDFDCLFTQVELVG